jgi:hypothetical protein
LERSTSAEKVARLVEVVKRLAGDHADQLNEMKQRRHELGRPDFVWHSLLQSFATLGNERGWDGLIGNQDNYDRVTFDSLSTLSPSERLSVLEQTLRDAKIRYPAMKARWLDRNYEIMCEIGGLEQARAQLLALKGREAKIGFLKQFVGIGDKYSRSMLMDVYDEDFRDVLALDLRIGKVSRELGLSGSYEQQEAFYVQVAREAGIEGWDLDRILYYHTDDVLKAITSGSNESG